MDQMISAGGVAGHALLIDCRTLEAEAVPLPLGCDIVVLDTATRRGLVDSEYNQRRAQCEAAAALFGVRALRDVSQERFTSGASFLDPLTRRRARHVISENERTLSAAMAMRRADAVRLGALMNESHISLRDDFEVSSAELDTMVECAWQERGCYGARMTGGGFGGCAVALVRSDATDQFVTTVAASYEAATAITPRAYVCRPSDGAQVVWGPSPPASGALESDCLDFYPPTEG
jgi:galactokinase